MSILNYVEYDKEAVKKLLISELDWQPYEGKHYESFYTRFYQGYILPTQFGIDKRYGHLSDLINAGQITKETARIQLTEPALKMEQIDFDKEYIAKKFDISVEDLEKLISLTPNHFSNFPNSFNTIAILKKIVNFLRSRDFYPK